MKISLDCFPCFLRQALEASRISGADENEQKKVLNSIMSTLLTVSPDITPPQIGWLIHSTIREITGNPDPYKKIKTFHNDQV
ncbi:MAG: protein-glutamate O-methyltransferase family protein, partial [Deltaproteobacteria bacterium]|nr:protein-glutamate O-methyltransferase family protein [Deltaproteobacteria bacterium]